mmetsp:Transcript_37184/g.121578  ORF Transcript_37184/g.121578 Transcript_37184/m.121578 type:complete len:352 (+) Transcript_37184:862-1917(+)
MPLHERGGEGALLLGQACGELHEPESLLLEIEDLIKEEDEAGHVGENLARVDDVEDHRRHKGDVSREHDATDFSKHSPRDEGAVRNAPPLTRLGEGAQQDAVHRLGLEVIRIGGTARTEREFSDEEGHDDEVNHHLGDADGEGRALLGNVVPGARVGRVLVEALHEDRVEVEQFHQGDDDLDRQRDPLAQTARPADRVVPKLRDGPRAATAHPRHHEGEALERRGEHGLGSEGPAEDVAVIVRDGLPRHLARRKLALELGEARDGPPHAEGHQLTVVVDGEIRPAVRHGYVLHLVHPVKVAQRIRQDVGRHDLEVTHRRRRGVQSVRVQHVQCVLCFLGLQGVDRGFVVGS